MRKLRALVLLASGATGCSLLVDTTNLTGASAEIDEDAGPTSDPARDVGAPDPSARDVGAPDPSAPDASIDSSVEAANRGTFCASLVPAPTFCRDFDDAELFSAGFDVTQRGPVLIATNSDLAKSPPASLLVTVQPNATEDDAYMRRVFPMAAADVVLAFDLLLEQAFASAANEQAALAAGIELSGLSGNAHHALVLYVSAAHAMVEEEFRPNGGSTNYDSRPFTTKRPVLGTWARVEIRTVTKPSPRVTVKVDGVVTVDQALRPAWTTAPPRIQLGISYIHPAAAVSPWRVRYDNVVVDLH